MFSRNLRIAVATREEGGLEDTVSAVFGRAETFTIIDIEGEDVRGVEVLRNPALSYKHGTGPIVVKTLIEQGIDVVVSGELGPGAESILEQHKITRVKVSTGVKVSEAVRDATSKL